MQSLIRRSLAANRLLRQRVTSRRYATKPPPETTPTAPPQSTSRITRLENRLPRFLRRYVAPLRTAPLSHITAFLILHELTAIVPLFGLAAIFHYTNWLPPYISEGKWVSEGTEKFGRWMKKKGWMSEDEGKGRWWGRGETGVRVVVELATAYAVTKALLPIRLVGSVWATPWFARWTVLPVSRRVGALFGKKKVDAAATGAVGGGAVPKGK
ncbi:hypothetical protein M409DRAFT_68392 [Zasmidium cellare ATCC 36951]|uniref:Uncharacterized protein n=1 Tax=Zasmidium cellare ATCC 36951 TaxID=1080233 RepID=A0A6A6C8G0_ZASCE|nr:uncharacterized protein M409DRAFT_68392 [Zasmidium cellare ATCC 36951]KAF2163434.1 hypothetical protein M409DRAFT_68392 [Zasmidium cellare ATCC 36951]